MNQENANKYILYARKSSEAEDRQVASIDSQITELLKIAERDKINIVEIISESMSAKEPGRQEFNKMIQKIHKGEADGILSWKINRLVRNPIDGGQLSWMLQQHILKHIKTIERNYLPTDNVLVMAVDLGVANQFILDLSMDTKRGLMAKAERGWYPCPLTTGYISNPNKKKGEKEIIEDPERFDLTRKMFDLVLTGVYNPREILEIATNEWGLRNKRGKKLAKSTFYRMLTDTFYYGIYQYPKRSGKWHNGKHRPMISIEEYDKIQQILGRKGKARPKTNEFALSGLIRCPECGAMIVGHDKVKRQKNGNIHYYRYYRCSRRKDSNCSQSKHIHEEDLEKQIVWLLDRLELPKEFIDWAFKAIKEENKKDTQVERHINLKHQREYNECNEKIKGLMDMRASKEITADEFATRKQELTSEFNRLKGLLDDSHVTSLDNLDKIEKAFKFAENAVEKFKTGSIKEKAQIVYDLGSNLTLKDGILNVSVHEPLIYHQEVSAEAKAIKRAFEPLKNDEDKRKLCEVYSQSPIMLRDKDSNLGYQGQNLASYR